MWPQWLTIVTSVLGVERGMEKGSGVGKNKNTSKIETDPWYKVELMEKQKQKKKTHINKGRST